jgi:hypothetical protein
VLLLAVLLALACLPGCEGVAQAQARAGVAAGGDGTPAVELIAAGDLRGEIQPCGCSPDGQQGGLPRRLSYLAGRLEGAAPRPLLVDLGNNFPTPSPQGKLKIALIQTLLRRFPPEAILPGPNELALGLSALEPALPWLLSNASGGSPFPRTRTVERGGRRIGLYGYLSPGETYQGPQVRLRLQAVEPALLAWVRATVAAERQDAAVLLFRGDDGELAVWARSGLFARIVAGNPSDDELHQVTGRPTDDALLPQVPTKGQGLLRMALPLAPAAGAPASGGKGVVAASPVTVDWLGDRWPDHPDAAPVFQAYDGQVKALFFAGMAGKRNEGEASPYGGAEACRPCHQVAAGVWDGTRHAHALATLERVGKQFDPECLACHVVGLNRGGFVSQALTPGLVNVQCENCHGPGRAHAANPAAKPGPVPAAGGASLARPAEPTCRTCHVGSHSPRFDFSVYYPRIRHPAPPPR